jgi:hypothetical protein
VSADLASSRQGLNAERPRLMTHFDSNDVERFEIDPRQLLEALLSPREGGVEVPTHLDTQQTPANPDKLRDIEGPSDRSSALRHRHRVSDEP